VTAAAVRCTGLRYAFGEHVAVDGVDLAVGRGEIFGLLGPNGAGKTTTIRLITTLLPVRPGMVTVFGADPARRRYAVRRAIGYVPQLLSADGTLTGRENVALFARLFDVPRRERSRRVADALDAMGLADAADRLARTYSGGMVRRLELAQALVNRPRLLILDEPTIGAGCWSAPPATSPSICLCSPGARPWRSPRRPRYWAASPAEPARCVRPGHLAGRGPDVVAAIGDRWPEVAAQDTSGVGTRSSRAGEAAGAERCDRRGGRLRGGRPPRAGVHRAAQGDSRLRPGRRAARRPPGPARDVLRARAGGGLADGGVRRRRRPRRTALRLGRPTEPGAPHYYRVQGPRLLIEWDNTQRGANHAHSVWRDPTADFGLDVLAAHRAAHH